MELRLFQTDDPFNFDGPIVNIGGQTIIQPGQTPIHIARLANFLHETQGDGSSDTALGRCAAWFASHVRAWPVTRSTVQWRTRDELELAVKIAGPNCSVDDLAAAIAALPNPGEPGAAPAETWDNV